MRVMVTGPAPRPLTRTIMVFFYGYFCLHWGTGILMFREKLGFSYASVVRYYLGDPDMFMNPRSFQGLLEVTHFHLFAMGLFFVVFTHLLLFTGYAQGIKRLLVWLLGLALAGDMAAGWLVRYLAESFAWLKLGSFWLLQTSSLLLFAGLLYALLRSRRSHPD